MGHRVLSDTVNHTMKFLIITFCIISIAFANQKAEPEECELCREAVGKLFSHLGYTWTDHTISMFGRELCHHADNPSECIEQANIWWPYIAKIIYDDSNAPFVCYDITYGVCEVTKITWDCDHCKNFIISVAHSYVAAETEIVEALQGLTFCENPLKELKAVRNPLHGLYPELYMLLIMTYIEKHIICA